MANELSLPKRQYQFGSGPGSYQPVNTDLLTFGDDTGAQRLARGLGSSGLLKGLARSFQRHQEEVETAYSKSLLETAKSQLLHEYENFVMGLSDPSNMMLDPAKYMSKFEEFSQDVGGGLSSSIDNQVSLTEFNTFKNEAYLTYKRKVNLLQQNKKIKVSEAALNTQAASHVTSGDFDWFNKPETLSWAASIMGGERAGIWAAEQKTLAREGLVHVNIQKYGTIQASNLFVAMANGYALSRQKEDFNKMFTYIDESGEPKPLMGAEKQRKLITEVIQAATTLSNKSEDVLKKAHNDTILSTIVACSKDSASRECRNLLQHAENLTGPFRNMEIDTFNKLNEQLNTDMTADNNSIVRAIEAMLTNQFYIYTNDEIERYLRTQLGNQLIDAKYFNATLAKLKDRDMSGGRGLAIKTLGDIKSSLQNSSTVMLEAAIEQIGVKGRDEAELSELRQASLTLADFAARIEADFAKVEASVLERVNQVGANWTPEQINTFMFEELVKTSIYKSMTSVQQGQMSGMQKILNLIFTTGEARTVEELKFLDKLIKDRKDQQMSNAVDPAILNDPQFLVLIDNRPHKLSQSYVDEIFDSEGVIEDTPIANFLRISNPIPVHEVRPWQNPSNVDIKTLEITHGGRTYSSATFYSNGIWVQTQPPSLELGQETADMKRKESLATVEMTSGAEMQVLEVVVKKVGDRVQEFAKIAIGGDIAPHLGMSAADAESADLLGIAGSLDYTLDKPKIGTITYQGVEYKKPVEPTKPSGVAERAFKQSAAYLKWKNDDYHKILTMLSKQTFWVNMKFINTDKPNNWESIKTLNTSAVRRIFP